MAVERAQASGLCGCAAAPSEPGAIDSDCGLRAQAEQPSRGFDSPKFARAQQGCFGSVQLSIGRVRARDVHSLHWLKLNSTAPQDHNKGKLAFYIAQKVAKACRKRPKRDRRKETAKEKLCEVSERANERREPQLEHPTSFR